MVCNLHCTAIRELFGYDKLHQRQHKYWFKLLIPRIAGFELVTYGLSSRHISKDLAEAKYKGT